MILDCAVYHEGVREVDPSTLSDAVAAARRREGTFAWLALQDPGEDELAAVAKELDLHELAVEDAINAKQRPKLEVYGDTLFMVLKAARYDDEGEHITFGDLMLFVGDGFVVIVGHGPADGLTSVRSRLERDPDLLRAGPAAVLYATIDHVVDDYAPVLVGLETDIEEVEEEVFSSTAPSVAERIHNLKREVLGFYRATSMLLDPLERLSRRHLPSVDPAMRHYFRDAHDHLVRMVGQAQGYRELLTSILEANLAQIGVRQNEDMRKISAWVAIVAAPTLIAGVYGMNFAYMPELEWRYGYPMALVLIAVICFGLHRLFRRSGWL
jgi:magnesium transporter